MCLAGVPCNYMGESRPCQPVIHLVDQGKAIPICPEQLGGLPTPRTSAERLGDRVFTINGTDVTEAFESGAQRTLKIARLVGADVAILKARSPSCGKGKIHDGTHTGNLIEGNGLTADLLMEGGIRVFTEEEI